MQVEEARELTFTETGYIDLPAYGIHQWTLNGMIEVLLVGRLLTTTIFLDIAVPALA